MLQEVHTEFFLMGIPDEWEGLYEYELIPQEPFAWLLTVSEKEGGFVFSLEARWFDEQTVQLESVWQGYLGRMNVERLDALDLLVTYSQPAPDASAAWQTMYEDCREVVRTGGRRGNKRSADGCAIQSALLIFDGVPPKYLSISEIIG